jgi:hypothetical protein
MLNRFFLLFFLSLSILACEPKAKFSPQELAVQEVAWNKMMEGHDVVMPLMGDIYKVSTKLKELAERAMAEANDFHPRAQTTLANLEAAEDGMMDWMANIKDNPLATVREKSPDHAAVMAFIEKEQTEITAVAENMNNAIAEAQALIKERNPGL